MVQIRSFIEGVSLAESKNSHDFVSRKEPVFTATVFYRLRRSILLIFKNSVEIKIF